MVFLRQLLQRWGRLRSEGDEITAAMKSGDVSQLSYSMADGPCECVQPRNRSSRLPACLPACLLCRPSAASALNRSLNE